ncbi:MAG: T9SS type A sorting domain-containing protein [Bacteroidota bacterium]|nr:T9SS type A sorting domain-containing protein [Bacteroidota bacterium]
MKNLLIAFSLLLSVIVNAQISIVETDMPVPADTFVINTAINFSGDPELTGAGYIWDYTSLSSLTQRVDSFIDPGDTPLVYSFVFNSATVALEMFEAPNLIPTITFSDPYDFFMASSSLYGRLGRGFTISGLSMPIVYDNTEVIYEFPLNYLDSYTGSSSYDISIPTFGYFGEEIDRETTVDGWGTLKLPMGDFDVLRVKCVITRNDTIYTDAIGIGMNMPPITTTEYHWLGKESGVPLLQVNAGTLGALTAYFQDVYTDTSTIGMQEELTNTYNTHLFPNPASNIITIEYSLESNAIVRIKLLDEVGNLIAQLKNEQQLPGQHQFQISCKEYGLSKAVYYIRFSTDDYQKTIPFFFTD